MKKLIILIVVFVNLAYCTNLNKEDNNTVNVDKKIIQLQKRANNTKALLDRYFNLLDNVKENRKLLIKNTKGWMNYQLQILRFGSSTTNIYYRYKAQVASIEKNSLNEEQAILNIPFEVSAPRLNLRSAPIVSKETLTDVVLNKDTKLTLIYTVKINSQKWGYIKTSNEQYEGWVNTKYIKYSEE